MAPALSPDDISGNFVFDVLLKGMNTKSCDLRADHYFRFDRLSARVAQSFLKGSTLKKRVSGAMAI